VPTFRGSSRWHAAAALLALAAVADAACGAAGECLRFSDCDPGLTCAYGQCVVPPPPDTDAAADGGQTTTPVVDAGSSTVITPTTSDASVEAASDASAE